MPKEAEPQQIKSVCEEVQYLLDHWADGELSTRDIRAGSTTFRRLFVHDELHLVWRTLISDAQFVIPANEILVTDEQQLSLMDLYTCSLVKFNRNEISRLLAFTGKTKMTPVGDGIFRDRTNYGVDTRLKNFSLNDFKNSSCIIAEGSLITRNWVIQYVANSLGGAHFGPPKKKKHEFKVAMAKLQKFDTGELPAVVRELLGIGQALCNSDSTRTLMAAYHQWSKENPNIRIA